VTLSNLSHSTTSSFGAAATSTSTAAFLKVRVLRRYRYLRPIDATHRSGYGAVCLVLLCHFDKFVRELASDHF
jgi:hypothetical protein